MRLAGQPCSTAVLSTSRQRLPVFKGKTELTQTEYDFIKDHLLQPKQPTISITTIIKQLKDVFGKVINKRDIHSVEREINERSKREVGYPYFIFPFSRSTSPYSGSLNDVSIINSIEEPQRPTVEETPKPQVQRSTDDTAGLPKRSTAKKGLDFIRSNKAAIDQYVETYEQEHGRKATRKEIEAQFTLREQAVKDWNHANTGNPIRVTTDRSERSSNYWKEKASRNERGTISIFLREHEETARTAYESGGIPEVIKLFPKDGPTPKRDSVYSALRRMNITA